MNRTPGAPMDPQHVADADQLHAQARELFDRLVNQLRAGDHDDPVTGTVALSTGLYLAALDCDHVDCLRAKLRATTQALAYAAATAAFGTNQAVTKPNLSGYTATEGGPFDA